MIISLLLGLAALIVALLGLKCIKVGSTTDETKAKIAVTGGVLAMLGGESAHVLSICEDPGRSLGFTGCCRCLLPGRRLLVRPQSRAGLLQPAQRRHQVSVHTHARARARVSITLLAHAF